VNRRALKSGLAVALEAKVPVRQRRVLADLRDEVLAAAGEQLPEALAAQAELVLDWTRHQFAAIDELHAKAEAFTVRLLNARDEAERDAAVLDLAERLGADLARLESDARALSRFLDADAVLERYRRRVGERERALAYGLERAGELLAEGLARAEILLEAIVLTEDFPEVLALGRSWRGDSRVRQAAHRALRRVAEDAGQTLAGFWVDLAVRDTRRVALNPEESVWAQVDAMATLLRLSPISLGAVLERRLHPRADQVSPLARDNRLFLRRQLAFLLADASHEQPSYVDWIQRLANDSDGAVRQALALAIPRMPGEVASGIFAKLRVDRDPQVRAALMAQVRLQAAAVGEDTYRQFLIRLLGRELDEYVLRMGLAAVRELVGWQVERDPALAAASVAALSKALTGLRGRSDNIKVRRWAGETREVLWLLGNPEARAIAAQVSRAIAGQPEGKARRAGFLSAALKADKDLVGRVLAVLAFEDFGFDLSLGLAPRLRRGDRFKRRLWRVLHELRTSSTDKRQAWLHTIGRAFTGPIIAPSARLAELAPTKVPGEPLHLGPEAGWRNFMPLLDHVLTALDRGTTLRIYSSEGLTLVEPPRGFFARLRGFFAISRHFAALAELRNLPGNDYAAALRQHGVSLDFAPHSDHGEPPDPQVVKLFGFGAAIPAIAAFARDAAAYFGTVYENTLVQLGVFIALAVGWFVGRHVWRGRRMRAQREGIALVLGGWGTRGKSGTERLKAGLINALGHPLVSKTTGCEAMFLLGRPFGDLTEMFLFRPYDKATIWEQFDLVRNARGLGARVFLWECMGLTPSYVRVLQRDWMRDDLSTITNTYPDHEDVQGPAGRNIPEVMTQFIPERGTLFTTEEEMYPILREGAELAKTDIRPVGWKEAGLIHQNLLARFPYAEHPFNIALVTAMAAELGLPADYAVKEMADRVVADLGVLKIYPRSVIDGRTLEFVMGMSANERFGAMGNWSRMGFAEHDVAKDPQIYISTVVNNRADRVPRSRVFARILVEDIAADRHVLIGSNIDGLMGFIAESWAEYAGKLTLFGHETGAAETFAALAARQRVPLTPGALAGRLAAMLEPQAARITAQAAQDAARAGRLAQALAEAGVEHGEAIAAHYDAQVAQLQDYQALAARVAAGGDQAAIDAAVREFLRACFFAKLVPVREFYTPGEQIIRLIAAQTPPGLINRIMGMQNIKGTGLDYVYRWQAWEACHKACGQALDSDPGIARRGLDLLGAFQEYGALSERHVRATIAELKRSSGGAAGAGDIQLDAILARLEAQMAQLDAEAAASGDAAGGSSGGKLGEVVEALLDSTDAVRRRRAADRIYRELIAEQISSQRAAFELKKLTSRQKGGWLGPSIASLGDAIRALAPWRRAGQEKAID
jgi:gamma-polyglutamate synthase